MVSMSLTAVIPIFLQRQRMDLVVLTYHLRLSPAILYQATINTMIMTARSLEHQCARVFTIRTRPNLVSVDPYIASGRKSRTRESKGTIYVLCVLYMIS